MKVIFLDVDGVLITAKTCHEGYGIVEPRCVDVLNSVIERTGAYIVLSSCWRIGLDTMGVKDLLHGWGVKGKVLGRTENLNTERGHEIQAWLDERKKHRDDVESFVIVDDDRDMAHLLPHLVHTTFTDGLTLEHAKAICEHLANGKADSQ